MMCPILLLLAACGSSATRTSVKTFAPVPVSQSPATPPTTSDDTTGDTNSTNAGVDEPKPQECSFSNTGLQLVDVGQAWKAKAIGSVTCNGTSFDFAAAVHDRLVLWCANGMSTLSQACETFPIDVLIKDGQTCVKVQIDTSPNWQAYNGFVNEQEVLCLPNE